MGEIIEKALSMNKQTKFIYSLMEISEKDIFFITDLEKNSGYKHPQKGLRKIVKALIEKGIIYEVDNIRGYPRYKLNKKLLNNLIRKGENFKINGKFIEMTKSFYSY